MSLDMPDNDAPLLTALSWVSSTLLGTAATAVAILAVAGIGLLMLNGRLNWQRGIAVVLGCFVISGASFIALGLKASVEEEPGQAVAPTLSITPPATVTVPVDTYDPYAGAAPQRRSLPTASLPLQQQAIP